MNPIFPGSTCLGLALYLLLLLWAGHAYAAPGDVLFSDDFDDGALCTTLSPNWTTSNTNLGGVSTQTSNSANCSMFTRGGAVANTSVVVDLSTVAGAELSIWIRRGADSFSEDPDGGEDLVVEYLSNIGTWVALETFLGGTGFGVSFSRTYEIPAMGLHANFQFRVRQTGGSGGPPANSGIGWDYYHMDDVDLTETGTPPPPITSDLGAGQCDDFESGFGNWQTSVASRSGINTNTSNSTSNSMFVRHATVTTTANPFDSAGSASFDVWIRRGSDAFSENPETNENLIVEYLDNSLSWVTLETFLGSGTPGQIFVRSYALPDAGRHANFSVRFTLTNGSGSDFDYWHIDDVCFPAGTPNLTVQKDITFEWDPVNEATDPFAIPGGWVLYNVTVTNTGIGLNDDDSLVLEDVLDTNVEFYAGDLNGSGSPFRFTDGTGASSSGLTLPFTSLGDLTDGVVFFDDLDAAIIPTAGFDADVRRFTITFPGQISGSSDSGDPTFTIEYRAQIK